MCLQRKEGERVKEFQVESYSFFQNLNRSAFSPPLSPPLLILPSKKFDCIPIGEEDEEGRNSAKETINPHLAFPYITFFPPPHPRKKWGIKCAFLLLSPCQA